MRKSFTLIEILIVSTIIGLLSVTASIAYSQFVKNSRDARRRSDLEQVKAALEIYKADAEVYPDSVVFSCSNPGALTFNGNVYLSTLPNDPKCNPNTNFPNYSYATYNDNQDYYLTTTLESNSQTLITTAYGNLDSLPTSVPTIVPTNIPTATAAPPTPTRTPTPVPPTSTPVPPTATPTRTPTPVPPTSTPTRTPTPVPPTSTPTPVYTCNGVCVTLCATVCRSLVTGTCPAGKMCCFNNVSCILTP